MSWPRSQHSLYSSAELTMVGRAPSSTCFVGPLQTFLLLMTGDRDSSSALALPELVALRCRALVSVTKGIIQNSILSK